MNMNNLRERYFSGRAYIGISPAIFLSASVWFTADEFAINLGYSFHLYLCCLLFFVSGFLCSKANSKDPLFSSRASYTFAFGLSVLSISSINDDPNGLTFLKRIIYSQQKPNENVRDKSLIGKILFILRMNTATQAGIPLYLIIIFLFFSPSSAVFPLQILIISQLFIGLALIVGKLVMKSE